MGNRKEMPKHRLIKRRVKPLRPYDPTDRRRLIEAGARLLVNVWDREDREAAEAAKKKAEAALEPSD